MKKMLKIKVRRDVFEKIMQDRETENTDIELEKGIRTVIVPPANGRIGYQYQKNFPENKRENQFSGKTRIDKDVRKLRQKLAEIKLNLSNAEKEAIEKDEKECTALSTKGDKVVKLHKSRVPKNQKNNDEKIKADIELTVAKIFVEKGFEVFMPKEEHSVKNKKNPDFIINGVRFELKSISGNLNNIQQRYRQALIQSTCVILSFKNRSEVPDFMRKQAALNGARLTNEKQDCLIFLFEDEKQIDFYDTSRIIKKGLLNNRKPLLVNEKTKERSEFRIKNDSRSYNGAITPTQTIPQNDKKSNIKLDYNGEDMFHKSFDIEIAEITEANREKKAEQTQKALNAIYVRQPFAMRHVKAEKGEKVFNNLVLRISSFDKGKIEKAVHTMAFTLDTKIKSSGNGEAFNYKAQEELTDRFVNELTEKTKNLYSLLVVWLGLPEVRILSKANLTYKGKILYNPESGEPIKQSEWKKFIKTVEDFLSKNYSMTGERIVLSAEALGRILERMSKTNSLEAVKKMKLENLSAGHRKFDWITDSVKNMKDTFGNSFTDRKQLARLQIAVDSAAQRVTRATDEIKNDIQQVIIDGIKNRQSKAKISQSLFEKCVGLNRDFQKIADTEIQNNINEAYVKEEVYNTDEGEKVYFKRFELSDDNTCKKCRAIKGKIALFSETPLESEKINDPYADFAIWEGKTDGVMPMGTLHPYCRGGWYRYYPETEKYRKD